MKLSFQVCSASKLNIGPVLTLVRRIWLFYIEGVGYLPYAVIKYPIKSVIKPAYTHLQQRTIGFTAQKVKKKAETEGVAKYNAKKKLSFLQRGEKRRLKKQPLRYYLIGKSKVSAKGK